jgi:hypothetical protein
MGDVLIEDGGIIGFALSSPAQKTNLATNCTSLGGAALTIWPNLVLLVSPFTAAGP